MVRDVIGTTPGGHRRSMLVDVPTDSAAVADHVARGYAEHLLGWVDVKLERPRPGLQDSAIATLRSPADLRGLLRVWESAPKGG